MAFVNQEESQKQLSALLAAEDRKVEITVENDEEAYRELARRTNLDRFVVLNTLFAKNEYGITIPDQEYSLPGLFKRYFKGLCDGIFTAGDLRRLTEILAKDNIDFPIKPSDIRVKVRKGLYEKLPYLYAEVLQGNKKQVLIGASRPDCAIYFLFTNDKTDVNNGTIFVRESSASALKFKNTFEVNPFVRGRGIVTDPETGATEVKDQLTFNPTWLTHTVKNMDAYVFAPLVYVPPKPVMPRRKKGAATGEVDINAMVEKTLAKANKTEVDAEKMVEEVRGGIDAYRDHALAEIAKRNEVSGMQDNGDNPVLQSTHDTLTATCRANQQAQCNIGKGVTLDPEVASQAGSVVQDSSFAEAVVEGEGCMGLASGRD